MYVDTHCHLNFNLFEQDLDQVLQRAWEHGLQRILVPAIDLATSRQVVALSEKDSRLYAAVGVHPNDASSWQTHTLDELRELACHPRVVAIGEIGLDYYRDRAPRELQQQVLLAQLELAVETGKPVVIHAREALSDLWPMLSSWQTALAGLQASLAERPGVLHSFDGSLEDAQRALAHGFLLGITGPVTYRNAPARQQLVAALPLAGLLLETDAPFLTPHPHRGKRNEPAYIPLIAEKIAELQALPISVIAATTTSNANRLFGWRSDL